ncbi:MAG: formylglycine-generating enzyme family protein [Candidatus Riflebacteria bacterium HGW-Riflebacteria-2]|nr:MAG: formylglycine-generating enzyme family protein [Candidatus Riflebacteria bacterium HGW-Riflebacteria-2]
MRPLVIIALLLAAISAAAFFMHKPVSDAPGGFVGEGLNPKIVETLAHASIASDGLAIDLGNNITMKFVSLNPGTFVMGSPESDPDAQKNEKPQINVTLTKGFLIGIHEVTQEQYKQVTNLDPVYFKYEGSKKHPVEHVTWFDAVRYCNSLSKATGLTPCYTDQEGSSGIDAKDIIRCDWEANGFRLPTEAEWEYACRAGTTGRYCCADELSDEYAWHWKNSLVSYKPNSRGWGTNPVASKMPNAWGLYDMHGSLWEWCWDWYRIQRTASEAIDPVGPATGTLRTYRGGAWSSEPYRMRSAVRHGCPPYYRNGHLTFRVLRIKTEK